MIYSSNYLEEAIFNNNHNGKKIVKKNYKRTRISLELLRNIYLQLIGLEVVQFFVFFIKSYHILFSKYLMNKSIILKPYWVQPIFLKFERGIFLNMY